MINFNYFVAIINISVIVKINSTIIIKFKKFHFLCFNFVIIKLNFIIINWFEKINYFTMVV